MMIPGYQLEWGRNPYRLGHPGHAGEPQIGELLQVPDQSDDGAAFAAGDKGLAASFDHSSHDSVDFCVFGSGVHDDNHGNPPDNWEKPRVPVSGSSVTWWTQRTARTTEGPGCCYSEGLIARPSLRMAKARTMSMIPDINAQAPAKISRV